MEARATTATVAPRCRHAGTCGGCQFQHLPYQTQLAHKRAALERLLRAAVSDIPPVAPVVAMPTGDDGMPWAFRHKSAFVFAPGATPRDLVMGHFAEGGREVVPVVECPVQGARANRIAFRLRDELVKARITAAGRNLSGVVRHIVVRTSADDRDAVAMLVVTRNAPELRRPVRALLASDDRPDGLFLNIHPTPSPYMVGRETIRLDGHAHVRERSIGPTFLVSPTAFFQSNPTAAASLVEIVLEAIDVRASVVLDLYSGSGLFTLPLAARGHRVVAVEENLRASGDAAKNLEVNRLDSRRVRLVTARVEDAIRDLGRQRVDAVVLDPPRQGCASAVIAQVFGRLAPSRAVYVSCHAASLAQELPAILAHGYRIRAVRPVDMFPHTAHVEVVTVLDRR